MPLQGMVDDYNAFMSELGEAIRNALYTRVRDGLIEEIAKSARKNVYSYQAKPFFMAQRRYEIADRDNFSTDVSASGTILTLENKTALRIGEPGEVNIVEEGIKSWGQPRPRPFMEEGLQEYVSSGKAEQDLQWSLEESGFSSGGF